MTWQAPARSSTQVSCTLTLPANPGITVAGASVSGGLTSTNADIRTCQLRIDFQSFRLTPPNPETTVCDEDYFTVSGSSMAVPKLCGDSYMDQHSKLRPHLFILKALHWQIEEVDYVNGVNVVLT